MPAEYRKIFIITLLQIFQHDYISIIVTKIDIRPKGESFSCPPGEEADLPPLRASFDGGCSTPTGGWVRRPQKAVRLSRLIKIFRNLTLDSGLRDKALVYKIS